MRNEQQRIAGGLLGIAVGDALGWPMENRGNRVGGTSRIAPEWKLVGWRRREGGSHGPHEQSVDAGSVSDDTQLALAVARSVLHADDWYQHLTAIELPVWTVYERGGGGATKRAARTWLRGHAPWDEAEKDGSVDQYFNAGGNGGVMRCLPHCLVAQTWEELTHRLDADTATTHGHPRALLGSRVYGWSAQWALNRRGPLRYGELLEHVLDASTEWSRLPALATSWHAAADRYSDGYDATWHRTVAEVTDALKIARGGLRQGAAAVDTPVLDDLGAFGSAAGAGTVTAVTALFLATRYLSQPQQGLLAAAFARGADTDTLAATTGGLLGLLAGDEWLRPLATEVQDSEYIRTLADQVTERRMGQVVQWRFTTRERSRLYRWLDEARPGDDAELPPFGHVRVGEVLDYDPRSQFVRSWVLETEIGQSLLVKRYDRGKDGGPRWVQLREPRGRGAVGEKGPSPTESPRVGLVLRVASLERASDFYTRIVGLTPQRTTDRYVSFGWLALEPGEATESLFGSGDLAAGPVIRVYVSAGRLATTRELYAQYGARTVSLDHPSQPGFRSFDPDGHPIEVIARNGSSA